MSLPTYSAEAALKAFREARCCDFSPEEDITDLIVDLLHYLDKCEGVAAPHVVLQMVKQHYEEESQA